MCITNPQTGEQVPNFRTAIDLGRSKEFPSGHFTGSLAFLTFPSKAQHDAQKAKAPVVTPSPETIAELPTTNVTQKRGTDSFKVETQIATPKKSKRAKPRPPVIPITGLNI